MSSLAPPPISRNRASSTTLRPALTLKSLGRRRSSTQLKPVPATPSTSQCSSPSDTSQPSMFLMALSTVLQWLHLESKHVLLPDWSSPSTPDETGDIYALPLPASATKSSFGDVLTPKTSPRNQWPSMHAPIVFVICLFPLSTVLVLLALSSLPISFSWPKTLTDLAELGKDLHRYSESGWIPLAHVVGVLALTAVWKHAWSIPGSVIWNVLAGALFSPVFATILLTILTTIGSLCASLLAAPLAPLIMRFLPRVLDMTRAALEGDAGKPVSSTSTGSETEVKSISSRTQSSGAWVRLSVLRLVGVVPWSGINIACGVCGVPVWDCMLGSFIGTLPWTAVTCQIGDILQTVAYAPSATSQTVSSLLMSPEIIIKLVFLSFLSLAPILARDHLKSLISTSVTSSSDSVRETVPAPMEPEKVVSMSAQLSEQSEQDERRVSRWTWMKEWKVRLPSKSRTREERDKSDRMRKLDELVDEKQRLREREEGILPS
ncbi:snare associated Golgi protein-domain-containing protein [Lentinula raphanica]|uniref:Snare associated Golgi protein-domain-containing protein n=1 Tax=Lentinula raphanica TaxID=153919 RepID=A0AA38PLI8_9AGAR|nr:snare associated Golgi protein-domain-containing protein [Lentinula raphanica]